MFVQVTLNLLYGFWENVFLFCVTLTLALPLGLVVTWGSMSKFYIISPEFRPIALITKVFIWLIRGTPLMLQLFIVCYVPGLVFDISMRNRMLAAAIAFVINYAAYFAEIYRGALENIPKGQWEAGKVLGLTKRQVFFHIILFQVFKRSTAPLGNETITLVKDTAIARVIAVSEVLMNAQRYAINGGLIWPLFYSALFFLAATAFITWIFDVIERKMAYANG